MPHTPLYSGNQPAHVSDTRNEWQLMKEGVKESLSLLSSPIAIGKLAQTVGRLTLLILLPYKICGDLEFRGYCWGF